jgi:hypothetical protein
MKRIILIFVAIMLLVSAVAIAEDIKMENINGQKVIFSDDSDQVVAYLRKLSRQDILNLAIIDQGSGQYYARILPEQEILVWYNGKEVSAYDVTDDMDEYIVLTNEYLLVQDEKGKVEVSNDFMTSPISDSTYPERAYNPEKEALNRDFIISKSYPNATAFDTISVKDGFKKQEMFKALVVGYQHFKGHDTLGFFIAWKVVDEGKTTVVKPDVKPESTPKPNTNPQPTKAPENNPQPKTTPENNPRPTERVPSGNGEKSDDKVDPLPDNNGRPTEGQTGTGKVSEDTDPMTGGNTGNGKVSGDTDPMTGGNTGNGNAGSNSGKPSESQKNENTGSGSVSHDSDPMNSARKTEPSSSSSDCSNSGKPSESQKSENTGSGSVSHDSDPFG